MNKLLFNQSMADYRAAAGANFSSLKRLLESPLDYKRERDGLLSEKRSAVMQVGSLLHGHILEEKQEWVVRPEMYPPDDKPWSGNSLWCKNWIAAQTLPVLSAQEERLLLQQSEYVRTHPAAQKLMLNTRREVSMFADVFGTFCKGRADICGSYYIADLKCVEDASTSAFSRAIATYSWHMQAALYLRLAKANGHPAGAFYFIALEKSELPKVNVLQLTQESIRAGDLMLENALALLRQCEFNNVWPDFGDDADFVDEPKTVSVPAWALPNEEEEVLVGGKVVVV